MLELISTDGGNVAGPTKTARLRNDTQTETLVGDLRFWTALTIVAALMWPWDLGGMVTVHPRANTSTLAITLRSEALF